MSKDVKFNIKLSIDGKEHIVEATTDVKHFAQELGIAETKGKRLRDSLLKFNGLVTLFPVILTPCRDSVCFLEDLTISSEKFRQSKEEEFSICHPSKCSSKLFDFCIKSFSGCIGQSLIKEVQYSFIVVGKSLDDGIKLWIFPFLNLVEP